MQTENVSKEQQGNDANRLLVADVVEESKGKWEFERSSGYAGYRCQVCYTWVYNNQEKRCDCDK